MTTDTEYSKLSITERHRLANDNPKRYTELYKAHLRTTGAGGAMMQHAHTQGEELTARAEERARQEAAQREAAKPVSLARYSGMTTAERHAFAQRDYPAFQKCHAEWVDAGRPTGSRERD